MTDYSQGHSVRCRKCGVLTHSEDIDCDCRNYITCPDCGDEFDADVWDEGIRGCFDHTEDVETLRDMIVALRKKVKELWSRARYKEAHIEEMAEEAHEELRA